MTLVPGYLPLCAAFVLLRVAAGQDCGGCAGGRDVAQSCLNDTGPETVRIEKQTVSYKCRNLPSFLSWIHSVISLPRYTTCHRTTYRYVSENTLVPFCCQGYTLTTEMTCKRCGRSKYPDSSRSRYRGVAKLIVGGHTALPNMYPWMVRLRPAYESYFTSCGGTIIGKKWVLTAAHCVHGSILKESHLIVGDHNKAWYQFGNNEKEYRFSKVYSHPKYKPGSVSGYDIALVRTDGVIEYNEDVQPACLPSEHRTYIGRTVTVAGWGITNGTVASVPVYLQYTTAKIKPPQLCNGDEFKDILCAQADGNSNICVGDSGGPMMLNARGYTTVIGVAWWSVRGCSPGRNFGYTNIGAYLDWIQKVITNNNKVD